MDESSVKSLLSQLRGGRSQPSPVPSIPPPSEEADIAEIGKLLKQERERLGLRHADVQSRSEIDTSFISRMENDKEANPTISTLRRYAQALSKTIVCRLVDLPPAKEPPAEGEKVTTFNREQAIDQFLAFLETEGITSYHMAYADLARTRVEEIANDYFPRLKALTDAEVESFLKSMRVSIERNRDHGMLDDWKMTTRGIADYLLRPGDLDGLHRMVAAECVIRLSGYTNHGVELYARFRPTAQAIGDAIWVRHGIKLPYIKIPDPWTTTIPTDDHEGYITIWDFAGQQRALASRILCFLCDNDFRNIYIPADEHDQIREEYRNNRDVLMRWSVSSDHVDRITRVLIVNKQELIDYLTRRRFNQSQTYKPAAGPRDRWFRTWKHSLPAAPATT